MFHWGVKLSSRSTVYFSRASGTLGSLEPFAGLGLTDLFLQLEVGGDVALVFGTVALGNLECGKSECGKSEFGWPGGDVVGGASTIGAAGASNVEATAWRGALWGSLRRREPR